VVVAERPDGIVLRRHRDLVGRRHQKWIRRGIFSAILVVPVLAAFNVFGQRPETVTGSGPPALLKLYAPDVVRGGVLFEARFHVTAKRELKDARLVLDPGWAEGVSINTIEPSPIGEASANGKLSFDLGHVPQGNKHILFMQFQVNPTNVAWHRRADVALYDGDAHIVTLRRTVTVYP
jgi:hypothetical protein